MDLSEHVCTWRCVMMQERKQKGIKIQNQAVRLSDIARKLRIQIILL